MAVCHASFTIQSGRRPTFHDVTPAVEDALRQSGIANRIVLVFSQHTTCRTEGQYRHPGPKHIAAAAGRSEHPSWSLNTDAHLRSVILGRSQSVPVVEGAMQLGKFGRIYFADVDQGRARERTVRVQIVGE